VDLRQHSVFEQSCRSCNASCGSVNVKFLRYRDISLGYPRVISSQEERGKRCALLQRGPRYTLILPVNTASGYSYQ
jgi:hypothetical protein